MYEYFVPNYIDDFYFESFALKRIKGRDVEGIQFTITIIEVVFIRETMTHGTSIDRCFVMNR